MAVIHAELRSGTSPTGRYGLALPTRSGAAMVVRIAAALLTMHLLYMLVQALSHLPLEGRNEWLSRLESRMRFTLWRLGRRVLGDPEEQEGSTAGTEAGSVVSPAMPVVKAEYGTL